MSYPLFPVKIYTYNNILIAMLYCISCNNYDSKISARLFATETNFAYFICLFYMFILYLTKMPIKILLKSNNQCCSDILHCA